MSNTSTYHDGLHRLECDQLRIKRTRLFYNKDGDAEEVKLPLHDGTLQTESGGGGGPFMDLTSNQSALGIKTFLDGIVTTAFKKYISPGVTTEYTLPSSSGTLALLSDIIDPSGSYVDLSSDQSINGIKSFVDGILVSGLSKYVSPGVQIDYTLPSSAGTLALLSDISDASGSFVDLSSNQTVNGIKSFVDGLISSSLSKYVSPGVQIDYVLPSSAGTLALLSDITDPTGLYVDVSSNQSVNGIKKFVDGILTLTLSKYVSPSVQIDYDLPASSGTLALLTDISSSIASALTSYVDLTSNQTITGRKRFDTKPYIPGGIITDSIYVPAGYSFPDQEPIGEARVIVPRPEVGTNTLALERDYAILSANQFFTGANAFSQQVTFDAGLNCAFSQCSAYTFLSVSDITISDFSKSFIGAKFRAGGGLGYTGSASSVVFGLENDTGIYGDGSSNISIAINGTQSLSCTSSDVTITGDLIVDGSYTPTSLQTSSRGSAGSVAIGVSASDGMYSSGSGNISLSAGGTQALSASSSGITVPGTLSVSGSFNPTSIITSSGGTISAVALGTSNTDGIYSTGAGNLSIAANGNQALSCDTSGVTIASDLIVSGAFLPSSVITTSSGTTAAVAFGTAADNGLFSNAAGDVSISAGGTRSLSVSNTGVSIPGTLTVTGTSTSGSFVSASRGTVSGATIAFSSTDGLYSASAGDVSITAGGVSALSASSTGISIPGTLTVTGATTSDSLSIVNRGTLTGATIGFSATDGLFSTGAGNISITAAGTQVISISNTGLACTGLISGVGNLSVTGSATSSSIRCIGLGNVVSSAIGFSNSDGFYSSGAGNVSITTSGVRSLSATSTGVTIPGNLTVSGSFSPSTLQTSSLGTALNVAIGTSAFDGLFSTASGNVSVAVGGLSAMSINTSNASVVGSFTATLYRASTLGSASAVAFGTAANDGIYSTSAGNVSISCGGSQLVSIGSSVATVNTALTSTGAVTGSRFITSGNGAATTPAILFNSLDGFYSQGASNVSLALAGSNKVSFDSGIVTVQGPLTSTGTGTASVFRSSGLGSVSAVAFGTAANDGIYSTGAGNISVSTGGTQRATISSSALDASVPVTSSSYFGSSLGSQSASTTSLRPSNTQNTGIWGVSNTLVGISVNGTAMVQASSSQVTLGGTTVANLAGSKFGSGGSTVSQMLFGSFSASDVINAGDNTVLATSVTFSTAFSSTPVVILTLRLPASGGSQNWDRIIICAASVSTTGFSVKALSTGGISTSGTATIMWQAMA